MSRYSLVHLKYCVLQLQKFTTDSKSKRLPFVNLRCIQNMFQCLKDQDSKLHESSITESKN